MIQIQQIKIFISCPSDIKEEIDSIRIIIEEINKSFGRQNAYQIECLNWKQDTYTQIGKDPQSVINNQLEPMYDILVGLMWQKIGTPTKGYKSGTIEEINRAILHGDKEMLLYFKTKSPEDLNDIDIKQLAKVHSFKKELSKKGILYKEFNSIESFESFFRINITNLISEKLLKKVQSNSLEIVKVVNVNRYESITTLIDQVEQGGTDFELDIFELSERNSAYLNNVTSALDSVTVALNEFTLRMDNRTKEIKRISAIKDDRLRISKTEIILNLFSEELNEFSSKINSELPRFSENFLQVGPIYSKLMQYATHYEVQEVDSFKESLLILRNSVYSATENGAELLRGIYNWPPMTSRFNKSKRETELALKNLTKDMLEGLRLLDEVFK